MHTPTPGPSDDPAHYFRTPAGDAPQRYRELELRVGDRSLEVSTAGGVFSTDRVDLGTRVLLREAPAPPAGGDLLDLGCGWGPIALALAVQAPAARVWAVDVNDRALELTAANAARHGLTGVRAVRPEAVPADVRFAAIRSNPPIRVGKDDLHRLLLQWLPRLLPGAAAHLVVQRNLGADSLHRWLAETLAESVGPGWSVQRTGSAKGYRVLAVTAPA